MISSIHYYYVNFRGNISCHELRSIYLYVYLYVFQIHQIALSLWETGDPGPDLAHPEDGVQERLGWETRGPVGLGLWAVSTR